MLFQIWLKLFKFNHCQKRQKVYTVYIQGYFCTELFSQSKGINAKEFFHVLNMLHIPKKSTGNLQFSITFDLYSLFDSKHGKVNWLKIKWAKLITCICIPVHAVSYRAYYMTLNLFDRDFVCKTRYWSLGLWCHTIFRTYRILPLWCSIVKM